MVSFIIRRVLQTFLVVFLVTIISFLLLHIIPGDPVHPRSQAPALVQNKSPNYDMSWDLDLSIHVQYIHWISGILHGDWGKSIIYHENVAQLFAPDSR